MQKLKDKKLVKLTLQDPSNYKYLVERYEEKLLRYLKRLLYINTEDAEDILQEVFLKAYRNLNSYNPKYEFSNWIYRIAHNEGVSFLRKNKKRKVEIANDSENNLFDSLASDIDLEKEYIEKDSLKKTKEVLSQLDPKYTEVLVLKFLEGMDYNEISEILHIPSGTVGSLISRAKVKLKELIELNGKSK